MKNQKPTVIYQISFNERFNSIPEAIQFQSKLADELEIGSRIQITYYKPQPQYKSWVPKWLIRLIQKP